MKKKIFAVLFSLCMILTLLPTTMFAATTYTVSFDKNGGYESMSNENGVSGEYTLPANAFGEPYGKYFKGWLVDENIVKAPGEIITITEDITLKAVWEDSHYGLTVGGEEVTYLNASGITNANISGTVSYDPATKTLTLNNATIYSVYKGADTLTSAIDVEGDLTINLVGDNTIYGDLYGGPAASSYRCAITGQNLTFKGNGNLSVIASDGGFLSCAIYADNNITIESGCTITAISNSDCALYCANLIASNSTVLASTSATGEPLAAFSEIGLYDRKYVKIQPAYNITVSFDKGSGTGTMSDQAVVCGREYTLPASGFTAPDGQQFKAWRVNGADKNVGDKVFLIENTTITAVWEDIPVTYYTVTFDSAGGSSVVAQSIEAGQKATKPSNPTREGYEFKGWMLNGTAYDFDTAVNCNITLVANWKAKPTTTYKIIEGANSSFDAAKAGTITVRADGEFSKFVGVKLNGTMLDTSKYTAKEGSTIVTLKEEYLNTLPTSSYTLTIVFIDGECNTDFSVVAKSEAVEPADEGISIYYYVDSPIAKPSVTSPKTGDDFTSVVASTMMLVSGAGLVVFARKKKTL